MIAVDPAIAIVATCTAAEFWLVAAFLVGNLTGAAIMSTLHAVWALGRRR